MFWYLIVLKVPLKYFDFMISVLMVIYNNVNYKAFDHVNTSKVLKFMH